MRHGRESIEHLKHGANWKHTLHNLGYLLVFGEEIRKLCAQAAEKGEVEKTDHQASHQGLEKQVSIPSVQEMVLSDCTNHFG